MKVFPSIEKEFQVVEMETYILFKIKDFQKLIDGKTIKISDETVLTFINITLGTVRGILVSKLTGTVFAKNPLPPMNPITFLKAIKEILKVEISEPISVENN